MDTARIAQHPSPNARELRALALAEERFEEIASSWQRSSGSWTVPSSTGGSYEVRYTRREESCSCPDWGFGHTCKHVMAVAVVHSKTAPCSRCATRLRHRELIEAGPEIAAGSFTVVEGERLCEGCASDAGAL